jgi:hypothetical protein
VKDVPSSIQRINEEGDIWNIKDNTNSYVLLLSWKNKNDSKLQRYLRLERR